LYDDIFEKKPVEKLLSPNKSQSIFDTEFVAREITPRSKTNKEYKDKAVNDVKNFMNIFTGYNINNSMPSQNPLKNIIFNKANLEKSERLLGKKMEHNKEKEI